MTGGLVVFRGGPLDGETMYVPSFDEVIVAADPALTELGPTGSFFARATPVVCYRRVFARFGVLRVATPDGLARVYEIDT